MSLPKLLTVKQVAKYLQVTEVTIRRWISEGTIESVKIGRARRIPEAALMRMVEAGKEKKGES